MSWRRIPRCCRSAPSWTSSRNDALRFGRRPIHVTVLRLGWNPRATTPSFLQRFFKRADRLEPLPSRPLPLAIPPS
ncbi:MAG: hypothetical protein DMF96_25335 [Acidobacteria bacterium]|nr:MAG: hypothetical protein DMF96_25335 [Acidobacteriota bacterium]